MEQDDGAVHVSYIIEKYNDWYEPFFIVLDNAPAYDERFIGYGNTRNTQVTYGSVRTLLTVLNYRTSNDPLYVRFEINFLL